jgi:hypothetical protein
MIPDLSDATVGPRRSTFRSTRQFPLELLCTTLVLLALPIRLVADGKFFPTALAANVTIPDQRALIHFTNGVERLVIETRFTGPGTNFAWVVPLPSQPTVEEASTGLFPTLEYLFRPRILHYTPRFYRGFVAFLGIGWLLATVRPDKRFHWLDLAACGLVGLAGAAGDPEPMVGLVAFVILLCCVMLARFVISPAVSLLTLAVIGVAVVTLFFPALAKSKAGSLGLAGMDRVDVLDRRLVGIYETTTIASRDPQALQAWLRKNGFAISTNSEPVIASYVQDGWIFVAARVRRDQSDLGTSTPHPLSFVFKTRRPVYPMRLTGVDNGRLEVALYVFGPSRAKAAHFTVTRCARPQYPQPSESWANWTPEDPNIVHPLLRKWVGGSPVATKLDAALSPEEMRQDVWIDWEPFSEQRSQVFSRTAAANRALNWGTGILACGLVAAAVLTRIPKGSEGWKRSMSGIAGILIVAGATIGGAIYLALPKSEVRLVHWPYHKTHQSLYQLSIELEDSRFAGADEARAEIRRIVGGRDGKFFKKMGVDWENYYLGGRIHEEDSPGNFVMRDTAGGIEFVAHDAQGTEHVLGTISLHPAR